MPIKYKMELLKLQMCLAQNQATPSSANTYDTYTSTVSWKNKQIKIGMSC